VAGITYSNETISKQATIMGLIYLASPYSHKNEAVRRARYLAVRHITLEMLIEGFAVFSPIVYGRDMEGQIGMSFEPWAKFNDTMLAACDEVHVLQLDGWEDSRGIKHELEVAKRLKKPVQWRMGPEFPA
jgi:hypothetical protein